MGIQWNPYQVYPLKQALCNVDPSQWTKEFLYQVMISKDNLHCCPSIFSQTSWEGTWRYSWTRAQNNGQSTDNVRPEWCLDWPKAPLAGHVDSEITQTPILEQTAKHSPINLRFCLFVKIQWRSLIQNYTRISSFFSHCLVIRPVWKQDLTKQKISLVSHRVRPPSKKLFWALQTLTLIQTLRGK